MEYRERIIDELDTFTALSRSWYNSFNHLGNKSLRGFDEYDVLVLLHGKIFSQRRENSRERIIREIRGVLFLRDLERHLAMALDEYDTTLVDEIIDVAREEFNLTEGWEYGVECVGLRKKPLLNAEDQSNLLWELALMRAKTPNGIEAYISDRMCGN